MRVTKEALLTIEARSVLANIIEKKIKESPNKALTTFDHKDALEIMSDFIEILEATEVKLINSN